MLASCVRVCGDQSLRANRAFKLISFTCGVLCGVLSVDLLMSYNTISGDYRDLHARPGRPLVILSLSYHESPLQDLRDLLEPLGVQFIEKGINNYACSHFHSCRSAVTENDKILEKVYDQVGQWTAEWFYSQFHNDTDWKRADAFLCFHPIANCEFFLRFNKPIIIWATIRLDNSRWTESGRLKWIETLKTSIAANPRNIMAANNRYDVAFTRYFTGAESVLLPSFCGYVRTTYNATRTGFLIYRTDRGREFTRLFMNGWNRTTQLLNISRPVQLTAVYDLYRVHGFDDLAAHRGIVSLPVQPSMMSIYEQYRMNIPLFFPSIELLVKWQMNRSEFILTDVNLYYGDTTSFRPVESQAHVPHPNLYENDSVTYWLKMSDWYNLPHVYLYKSLEHLVILLNGITDEELRRTSEKMKLYNEQFRKELVKRWRSELMRITTVNSGIVLKNVAD